MFTKEEQSEINSTFWSKLKNQMTSMKNPHGTKVNWMRYNTGINHLYFRMEADEHTCKLCIDLQFPDASIREVYWDQFMEFQIMLEQLFKSHIHFYKEYQHTNGKTISRIIIQKNDVNIYRNSDWDKMHLFLKLNFAKLDKFWDEYAEVFLQLK